MVVRAVRDDDLLCSARSIRCTSPRKKCVAFEHLAHRIDDVRHVEVAGGHLVQHRREGEEVLAVDECELNVGVTAELFLQLDGGVESAEAAAEQQDSGWCVAHVGCWVRCRETSLRCHCRVTADRSSR